MLIRWRAKAAELADTIAAYKDLKAEYSDLPDYRLRLPGTLFEAGRQTEAIELLEGCVKELPESPQYRDELAYLYEQRATGLCRSGKFDDAVPIVLKLAKEFPNRPDFRAQLAYEAAKADRLEGTMAMFEKTAEAFSDQPDYRPELAARLDATGAHSTAATIYEQLIDDHPGIPDYRVRLGDSLLSSARWDEAIAGFEKLADEFPNVSKYRSMLGNAYGRRGDDRRKNGELERAAADRRAARAWRGVAGHRPCQARCAPTRTGF